MVHVSSARLPASISSIQWSIHTAAAPADRTLEEDDLEAHYRRHEGCPRCVGEDEIPDSSTTAGGTRLCPGPLAALDER